MITSIKRSFPIDWSGTYENVFEVHGGQVLIHGLLGVITEQFDANTSLTFDGPFSSVNLPATSAVGVLFTGGGGTANSTNVKPFVTIDSRYVWGDGEVIRINPDRVASTGKVELTIWYEQLESGAYMAPA